MSVLVGDCVEVMAAMPDASVDAIVTDPPYGLEFMGKTWDRLGATVEPFAEAVDEAGRVDFHGKGNAPFGGGGQRVRYGTSARSMQGWHEAWAREALRVLKPGGHLLAFGGTRTYHRLACAVEDAGFEIRDSLQWIYGSGFPKSLDVSKAIDKAAGAEREVVGADPEGARRNKATPRFNGTDYAGGAEWQGAPEVPVTAPATPEAACWQGWGTALKPAFEPIVVARKPLIGTVAGNVLAHGTGALNVDGCRVEWGADGDASAARKSQGYSEAAKKALGGVVAAESTTGFSGEVEGTDSSAGRWPPNVLLSHSDGCVLTGTRRVKASVNHHESQSSIGNGKTFQGGDAPVGTDHADADGMETVEAWKCVEGCPVRELDRQSGDRKAGGKVAGSEPSRTGDNGIYGTFGRVENSPYGDTGGASRFFPAFQYQAKASRAERNAGLNDRSYCETCAEWVNAVPLAATRADSEPPLRRATTAATTPRVDDKGSGTTLSGRTPTDQSLPDSMFTTSTGTSRTTGSPTSNSSQDATTSENTPTDTVEVPMVNGSVDAVSAASGSPPPSNISTSLARDGSPTADADHAISASSSEPSSSGMCPDCRGVIKGGRKNVHPLEPTVKPIDLMRWLVRLITPPGGTVLDPFVGSGTTGCAAVLEGFEFIGIERDPEYVEIARARIAFWAQHPTSLPIEKALAADRDRSKVADSGQLTIL